MHLHILTHMSVGVHTNTQTPLRAFIPRGLNLGFENLKQTAKKKEATKKPQQNTEGVAQLLSYLPLGYMEG